MSQKPITIRTCHSVAEFEQMVDLQVRVWQYSERDAVPAIMFVVAAKTGGQVMGAFDGEPMVGFALAYPGIEDGMPYLHSHMAAVLPQYRDRGVGRELKLAQRADALARGIDKIEWTFDPLQAKNAYFNICRLGVVIRSYLPNLYGQTSSPLHGSLPTDRLLAEWHLNSERVRSILAGERPHVGTYPQRVQVVVPEGATQAQLAELQAGLRGRFEMLFTEGYAVTWLEREPAGCSYILERASTSL